MQFELIVQPAAIEVLERLQAEDEKKLLKVQKCLGLMQSNLRHPRSAHPQIQRHRW